MMLFVLKPIIQYNSNGGKERKKNVCTSRDLVDCGLVACEWLSLLAHCFTYSICRTTSPTTDLLYVLPYIMLWMEHCAIRTYA